MSFEERMKLRDEVQNLALKELKKQLNAKEKDWKAVKLLYALKTKEEEWEMEGKRSEITGRRFAVAGDDREFTVEETAKGIRAMLGKGEEP